MQITEVKVYPTKGEKLKANASVTLDNCFVFKCKIMQGPKGVFVAMPSEKGKDREGNDKYYDHHFPITKEFREAISSSVLGEYEKTGAILSQAAQGNYGSNHPPMDDDDLPF